jgi:hypothetical protein
MTADRIMKARSFILCAALAASPFLPAEATARFGLALDAVGISPFREIGGFVAAASLVLTSGWKLASFDEDSSLWLTVEAGYGLMERLIADAGLLWENYPAGRPGKRIGFSVGAGYDQSSSFSGRAFFRYDPLAFRAKTNSGGETFFSFLDLAIGAAIGPGSFEDDSWDGILLKVGLIEAEFGVDGAVTAENWRRATTPASVTDPELEGRFSPHLLLETSLTAIPNEYVFIPLPFTEWSLGVELSKGFYSASAIIRFNAVMLFLDNYETLRLELVPLRARIGIWRPAIGFGVTITDIITMAMSGGTYMLTPMEYLDVFVEPLCFDLRTRSKKEFRLSILPLSSNYLSMVNPLYGGGSPPVFHILRAGYRF